MGKAVEGLDQHTFNHNCRQHSWIGVLVDVCENFRNEFAELQASQNSRRAATTGCLLCGSGEDDADEAAEEAAEKAAFQQLASVGVAAAEVAAAAAAAAVHRRGWSAEKAVQGALRAQVLAESLVHRPEEEPSQRRLPNLWKRAGAPADSALLSSDGLPPTNEQEGAGGRDAADPVTAEAIRRRQEGVERPELHPALERARKVLEDVQNYRKANHEKVFFIACATPDAANVAIPTDILRIEGKAMYWNQIPTEDGTTTDAFFGMCMMYEGIFH
jgi:hypothetical protein